MGIRTFQLASTRKELIIDFTEHINQGGVFGGDTSDMNATYDTNSAQGLTGISQTYSGEDSFSINLRANSRATLFKQLQTILESSRGTVYLFKYSLDGSAQFTYWKYVMVDHVTAQGENDGFREVTMSFRDIFGQWFKVIKRINGNVVPGNGYVGTLWTETAVWDDNGNPVLDPDGNILYDEPSDVIYYAPPNTGRLTFYNMGTIVNRVNLGWADVFDSKHLVTYAGQAKGAGRTDGSGQSEFMLGTNFWIEYNSASNITVPANGLATWNSPQVYLDQTNMGTDEGSKIYIELVKWYDYAV